MPDRSAWWRTAAGIAAWVVLVAATAGLAWAAVAVVADQGDATSPVTLPDTRSSSAGGNPTPGGGDDETPTTSSPTTDNGGPTGNVDPTTGSSPSTRGAGDGNATPGTDDDPEPGGQSRVVNTDGGSVSVQCVGSEGIRLVYASSADGWVQELNKSGPDDVDVEFARDDEEIRIRASCEGGSVVTETDAD